MTIREHVTAASELIATQDAMEGASVNPYLPIAHLLLALVMVERAKLRVLRREVRILEAERELVDARRSGYPGVSA